MILFFKVKWILFLEKREVQRRFPAFKPFECALRKAYRFQNPYRICKDHLVKLNDPFPDAYGETPLPLLFQIAEECSIGREDNFFELGCGRGRGSFFLSCLFGCQVVGIDWNPIFIEKAKQIARSVDPELPISFHCSDMRSADLSKASVVFLYGTCLSEEIIRELIVKFKKLPIGVKVITVSYPLSDYCASFTVVKQLKGAFPWGEGDIYINQRRPFISA